MFKKLKKNYFDNNLLICFINKQIYQIMEYISLGSNCSITHQLSKLGLRKCAYPFDWTKITLNQLISILVDDFNDYSKSLEFVSISHMHPIIEYEIEHETNNLSNDLSNDLISSSSLILTNKYKIKFAHELGRY